MPTSKIHPSTSIFLQICHIHTSHNMVHKFSVPSLVRRSLLYQALCILQNGFAILLNCLFVCKIKKFGVNMECGQYEFFIGHILGRVSFVAYLDYSSAISTSEKTKVGDQNHILCILYGEANTTFLVIFPLFNFTQFHSILVLLGKQKLPNNLDFS